MANYNFDEIIDRTGTDSMKYDAGRVYNPDLPEKHIPIEIKCFSNGFVHDFWI